MLRNLAANLILHEHIETTDAKARATCRVQRDAPDVAKLAVSDRWPYTREAQLSAADKARRLAAQRAIAAYVPRYGVRPASGEDAESTKVDLVEKVLLDLAQLLPRPRPGGYTRIIKFGPAPRQQTPPSRSSRHLVADSLRNSRAKRRRGRGLFWLRISARPPRSRNGSEEGREGNALTSSLPTPHFGEPKSGHRSRKSGVRLGRLIWSGRRGAGHRRLLRLGLRRLRRGASLWFGAKWGVLAGGRGLRVLRIGGRLQG